MRSFISPAAHSPNGTVVALTAGSYSATIFSVGATLAGLTLSGVDLVVPCRDTELPPGYLGKTLVPWPNRIADGRYIFNGSMYTLPVNDPATNSAVHGLGCWLDWSIKEISSSQVTLEAFIVPQYGYPFHLCSQVTYRLNAHAGLEVEITSTNVGSTKAPYGVSAHPYLACGIAPVDECTLQVPADVVTTVDKNLIPSGSISVEQVDMDFRDPRTINTERLDHTFGGLPTTPWQVTLTHPPSGVSTALISDSPWVQLYSGEIIGRRGLAVEPMTCQPDAYNSGVGLIVLKPSEQHTLQFRIATA